MVDFAIWIVSALVILWFVVVCAISGFGILAFILSDGRWKVVLSCVALVTIFLCAYLYQQNKEWESQKAVNAPLFNQCASAVDAKKQALYWEAYQKGAATKQYLFELDKYESSAKFNCRLKYPH